MTGFGLKLCLIFSVGTEQLFRQDGAKAREADGQAFLLPQEDPEQNTYRLKCYKRPEFMIEPVRISVDEFSKVF